MNRLTKLLTITILAACSAAAGAQKNTALRIYFIDVEGGQSTLFVAPGGQSLLVDAGWPGSNNRDADRIAAAAQLAGITRIDNLLVTHYHTDHVGGLPQIVSKIPVTRFLDHGPNREQDGGVTEQGWAAYQKVLADTHAAHQSLKPGDKLSIGAMRIEVVAGDGEVIAKPLAAAGKPNPACAGSPEKAAENSENDRSLGFVLTFGKTRILDLGDLTWNKERPLMCPVDKLGKIDVYVASHHGFDRSGSPALVDAIAPRLAIMDNGGHKGADAGAWQIVDTSPRLQALWQLHTAEARNAHNVPSARIANLSAATGGPAKDAGYALELTVQPTGALSMKNLRTGETVPYSLTTFAPAQQSSPPKIIAQLDQASAKFQSTQADFEWDYYERVVKETTKQSGTIYFQRKGAEMQIGAKITSPSVQFLQVQNGVGIKFDPNLNQIDQLKAASLSTYLSLGFGGSGTDMAKSWTIADQGADPLTVDGKTVPTEKLDLVSKDANTRNNFSHITIWIDLQRGISLKQQVFEPGGNYRTSLYSHIRYNEKVDTAPYTIRKNAKTVIVNH